MNHVIITRSGVLFDLANPKPENVRLDDITAALSNINRFTGHTRTRWTVAQHVLLCRKLVSLLHPHTEHGLRLHALLHDAAEAYIGDISSPLKGLIPAVRPIEEKVLDVIYRHLRLRLPEGYEKQKIRLVDNLAYFAERAFLMPTPSPITLALPISDPDYEAWRKTTEELGDLNLFAEIISAGIRFIAGHRFQSSSGGDGKGFRSPGSLAFYLLKQIHKEIDSLSE